ncbi:MAG: polysaccharide biosynthesis tyrosine autokinase [Cyanobacteria bacterium J069]|nr:MAG: polysaccharide biosynthesis tyrosine autokinase [Cyanobacteria bacterium J069]
MSLVSQDYSEEIDFQKYWNVLKRRWLPATSVFLTLTLLSAAVAIRQKSSYQAETLLQVRSSGAAKLTGVGEGLGELEKLTLQSNPVDSQAQIIQSAPIVSEVIRSLDLRDEKGEPVLVKDFLSKLKANSIPATDLLRVTYASEDPEETAAVINRLVDIYTKNNVLVNRAEAAAARDFIAKELPKTEAAVKAADSDLRRFKEANGVVLLESEAQEAVNIISKLEDQVTQARAELSDTSARLSQLQGRVGADPRRATVIAALSQSPGVQEALTQLQLAQQELAVERTRYTEDHPAIANLQRRVRSLEDMLQSRAVSVAKSDWSSIRNDLQAGALQQDLIGELVRLEVQRQGIVLRLNTLSEASNAYRQRASALPRLEQQQRELERRLNAAQTTYEALLLRLQEIQVAENQNIGNVRVVSPAIVPDDPLPSQKKLFLIAGSLAGMLLGVATAFGLDLFDRSIKTVKEAKEALGYTLLGVVPAFSRNAKSNVPLGALDYPAPRVVVRDMPQSPIAASYQMLQANLKFLSSDKAVRSFVITSSVAQEGKSEIAANLAATMAQLGRKVLLVDADLRRPAQHHTWNLVNAAGLTNLLIDQVSSESVIQEVMPGLHVLPSGVVPPNPVALLDSKRMASLVEDFLKEYDFVLFDTPPLAGIADAAVLGKMTDGMVLVVRPGVVDSSRALAAREFLKQSGQQVLGMVLNCVDVRNEPDSYFYYAGNQYRFSAPSAAEVPQLAESLSSEKR